MIPILFYNHDPEVLPIESILSELESQKKIKVISFRDQTQKQYQKAMECFKVYQYAIFHGPTELWVGDKPLDEDIWWYYKLQDSTFETSNNLIVFFISSDFLNWEKKRINFGENSSRYLIPVPRTKESGLVGPGSDANWALIFSAISDINIVEAYFNNDSSHKGVNVLKRFFDAPKPNVIIAAITIICQIYLSTHSPDRKGNSRISDILFEIGWWNFCEQQSSSRLVDLFKSHRAILESSGWYTPLKDNLSKEELLNELYTEIDNMQCNVNEKLDIENVKDNLDTFLTDIYNEKPLNQPSHLELVADIYIDLKQLMQQ